MGMTGSNAFISIRNVSKFFGTFQAIDDVSMDIGQGEFFSLLGASGCGKTTLLRMLAGFESTSRGEIFIDGQAMSDVPPHHRPVNMVFQNYAIFPHLNVRDNIAYGLRRLRLARAKRDELVDEMLDLIKLPGYGSRKANELSGGQRQRIALARALILRPKVLLLDEPLGALDKQLREQMQLELRALQRQVGITFVFVTHDQHEALSMADRLAVFNEGRIAQIGTPQDIYDRPKTRFVADFVGSSNVLPPDLTRALGGPAAWASLRAEAVQLSAGSGLRGTVAAVRYLGAGSRVVLRLGEAEIAAYVPSGAPVPDPGTEQGFVVDPAALHVMEG